jgi:inward rectifier potassium channel
VASSDEHAAKQEDTGVDVVNLPRASLSYDLYHRSLRASWTATLLGIGVMVVLVNLIFATLYWMTDGISGARPGSFADAFFFSVETLGTIGYGNFYPKSMTANVLVTVESVVGLLVFAISTGLIFAKFSIPTARIAFSRVAVVSPLNGVPSLAFRVGNLRGNYVVDATMRLTLTRLETTSEGKPIYRMLDLKLLRERSPSLGRTWSIVHSIDESSPLRGATAESLLQTDAEIQAAITGIDSTSSQTVHARYRYDADDILFGKRFRDMIGPLRDGRVRLDFANFHETEDA